MLATAINMLKQVGNEFLSMMDEDNDFFYQRCRNMIPKHKGCEWNSFIFDAQRIRPGTFDSSLRNDSRFFWRVTEYT